MCSYIFVSVSVSPGEFQLIYYPLGSSTNRIALSEIHQGLTPLNKSGGGRQFGNEGLFVIDPNGKGPYQVTEWRNLNCLPPNWTPNELIRNVEWTPVVVLCWSPLLFARVDSLVIFTVKIDSGFLIRSHYMFQGKIEASLFVITEEQYLGLKSAISANSLFHTDSIGGTYWLIDPRKAPQVLLALRKPMK